MIITSADAQKKAINEVREARRKIQEEAIEEAKKERQKRQSAQEKAASQVAIDMEAEAIAIVSLKYFPISCLMIDFR